MLKKIFTLFLAIAIIVTSVNIVFAGDADEGGLFDGKIPNVIGIQLKNEDMGTSYFNKFKSTGVGLARKGIYWSNIESQKGKYNWTQTDTWVNHIEDAGMGMIMTVVWNNRLYEDIHDRAIVTDAGRKAFAKFTSDLVTRYKGKNIIFEIWNEPNLRGFWHENESGQSNTKEMAKEYTDMVLECVPAMKTADPDCKIAICSISCLWSESFSWFEGCISSGILKCDADYISVHPYGFSYPEKAMNEGYPIIRQYLDANGRQDIGIINSEVGFDKGSLINQGATESNVLDAQAWYFVRQNIVDMMSGVEASNWYEFSDTESWGVINNNLTERPTYTAAKVMTSELNGYKYVKRVYIGNPDDYIALFENDNGDKKIVTWTASSKLNTNTAHEISIPVGTTGIHTVKDVYGNVTTLNSEGNTLKIIISDSPQYIDNVNISTEAFEETNTKFALLDDTYADGGNKNIYRGAQDYIYTKAGESRNIYIKGDISKADKNREIESVKLYLYMFVDTTSDATINVTARNGGTLPVWGVRNNTWSEESLKWNDGIPDRYTSSSNKFLGNLVVESEANGGFDRYYAMDITDFALASKDGIFTLKITGDSSNTSAYKFKSKECGDNTKVPYIEVTYKTTPEEMISMTKGSDSVHVTVHPGFTGVLMFVEYDTDDTLKDIDIIDEVVTDEYTVPHTMTGSVKAMLVENIDNIRPIVKYVDVK